jgi:hypothetical protein
MRARKGSGNAKPLPGSRPLPADELQSYIVTFKEADDARPEAVGRRELYESGLARATEFQRELRVWLDQHGVDAGLAKLGEPTTFPMVVIRTIPQVAELIESHPKVEAVLRNSDDFGLIR